MHNCIKIERVINELTQEELAKKVGVSRQTIINLESDKYLPSLLLAWKVAQVFGKTIEEVFFIVERD